MDPLESLQSLERIWQREPVMDHDDTPVSTEYLTDRDFPDHYHVDCPQCGGSGDDPQYGPAKPCGKCGGTGKGIEADV